MKNNSNDWWKSWTRKDIGIVFLFFLIIMVVRFPFILLFDIVFTKIGNFYVYFWALPEALILYFIAFRFKIRWTSTAILGIEGIIGIPIDYYFEWVEVRNLISPWCAVGWGIFFIIMGLSADITLIFLRPEKNEVRAATISSLLFTGVVLILTYLGNTFFYNVNLFYLPYLLGPDWNTVAPIFVPYALGTGILGGYLGYYLHRIKRDG